MSTPFSKGKISLRLELVSNATSDAQLTGTVQRLGSRLDSTFVDDDYGFFAVDSIATSGNVKFEYFGNCEEN